MAIARSEIVDCEGVVKGDIQKAIDGLEEAVSEMDRNVADLETRIKPILKDQNTGEGIDDPKKLESECATWINDRVVRLLRIAGKIREITYRVDL